MEAMKEMAGGNRSPPIGTLQQDNRASMEQFVEMEKEAKGSLSCKLNGKRVWEENYCQKLPKNQDSLS